MSNAKVFATLNRRPASKTDTADYIDLYVTRMDTHTHTHTKKTTTKKNTNKNKQTKTKRKKEKREVLKKRYLEID